MSGTFVAPVIETEFISAEEAVAVTSEEETTEE